MKKLVSRAIIGKDFFHQKSGSFFADEKYAGGIADALNEKRYALKAGETWHVYDYDYSQESYAEFTMVKTPNGFKANK